jgi:hypothetical protein
VPTMSATQIKRVSELYRPKPLYCETCNSRAVVSDVYIITLNHSAHLDLVCPNHAAPHPDGHDVGHMLLEPEAAREVGL